MFKTDVVYHPGAEIELDRIPADMTTGRQLPCVFFSFF